MTAGRDIKCPGCGSDDVKKKVSSFSAFSLGAAVARLSGQSAQAAALAAAEALLPADRSVKKKVKSEK